MKRLVLFSAVVCLAVCGCDRHPSKSVLTVENREAAQTLNRQAAASLITGSFVIANDYVNDRAGFQKLLDEMKALNLSTVILHSIGYVDCSGGASRTVPDNVIGWMLTDAQNRGMNVYIGMYANGPTCEFWSDPWKTQIINNSVQAVKQIDRLYRSRSSFKGYYVVQEAHVGQHLLYLINPFYTDLIAQVHAASPNKKVIAGGYMKPEGGSPTIIQNWVSDFKSNGLDIFLLQDGVGSFDNSITVSPTIYDYFVAARNGVSPKPLWADVELFQWSATKVVSAADNWYHPANTIRINQQIYFANAAGAAQKISWINQHHMTLVGKGANKPEAKHLHRGYKALYFTGKYYDNPSYSFSPQPSPQYPDNGGMLFDNSEGQFSWANWVGFGQPAGSNVTVTVDLGSIKSVSDVTAVVRSETNSAIYYPTTLTVRISTDGQNYNLLGAMQNPYSNAAAYSKAYLWISTSSQQARYVKLEFVHGGWWLFLSELEVYGI